jgi:hypothetical protein
MRRLQLLVLILLAIVIAILAAPTASSAVRHDPLPLRFGSSSPTACGLKWMISGPHGHRPNVFTKIHGTYTGNLAYKCNYFGPKLAAAIVDYKWRLGYPKKWVKPVAGRYFIALLRGTTTLPVTWKLNASRRVQAVEPGATPLALKIKAIELSQLGVTEHPLGSNTGAQVSVYQRVTGALGLAWCVSFQQWAFLTAGYGTFADRTASVYYALDYYAAVNLVFAKPKVGALVAFVSYDRYGHRIPGTGHTGFVAKVTAAGFASIEGNQANGVHEVFHPWQDTGRTWRDVAFIYPRKVATP